ncbi:hypothetical protein [Actinoplanes couchii]|uniref:Integral membrane protein n=1 Tax=Actinoplanes couchii TaxID=403638 RepID=A0ABQ3X2L2_9ACTN|nr:hypothetical protein [Actinoplanes couchii]MDR6322417.1 hypothetical protein [Actinoplanes couchii]GID52650.1 hypothetical protein Aco03nite_010540 [Actinoplanes couchii]
MDALIAEYERLKEEQTQRIGTRDNLIYATLASIAAICAGALQTGIDDLLLTIAPCCVVLGWTYLVNDEKISSIGRYIRTDLSPRLSAVTHSDHQLFGWDSCHRDDRRRHTRKVIQLGVDLLVFCIPAFTGIALRILRDDVSLWAAGVLTTEITLVLILAFQIVTTADLNRR